MTPQHGPSWADDDRAWEAFAPEPKHLAQRPRAQWRHPVRLVVVLVLWTFLLAAVVAGIVRVVS